MWEVHIFRNAYLIRKTCLSDNLGPFPMHKIPTVMWSSQAESRSVMFIVLKRRHRICAENEAVPASLPDTHLQVQLAASSAS